MSIVLTLLAIKGGVGKTTTAVNLAGGLRQYGDVLLVDCDPQDAGSSTYWLDDPASTVNVVKVRDVSQLEQIAQRWPGLLVIDTPRSDDVLTHTAIQVSSLVICPCGPSQAEVVAARQSAHLVPSTTPCRVLLTRVDGRSIDLYHGATNALDIMRIPRLSTSIRLRTAHVRAQEEQTTILEMRGRDRSTRDGGEDYRRLVAEVVGLLGLGATGAQPLSPTGGR